MIHRIEKTLTEIFRSVVGNEQEYLIAIQSQNRCSHGDVHLDPKRLATLPH